jgi:uncharacterized membrane protein
MVSDSEVKHASGSLDARGDSRAKLPQEGRPRLTGGLKPHLKLYRREEPSSDKRVSQVEVTISRVLRTGVLLSAGIISFGMLDLWLLHRHDAGTQAVPKSLTGIWFGLSHADPSTIVAVGLLLLVATPVIRVAVSMIAFAVSHDLRYVGITSLVLAILLFSFLSGLGGG